MEQGTREVARWGRGRLAWVAVLSLVPGLGHVHARAFRTGVALLGLNLVLTVGFAAFTRAVPPGPGSLAVLGAVLALNLVLIGLVAVHAVRRARTAAERPRPPWFRSTGAVAAAYVGLSVVAPSELGWRSFFIPSESMLPGLRVGDVMLVHTEPGAAALRRGDVVVFGLPSDPAIDFVKRVAALPGDRIALRENVVMLNGAALAQGPGGGGDGALTETQPDGRGYAILRTGGAYGFGRTTEEVLVPPGHFFVLGDNRDNSVDSRFAMVGLVPEANLVGRAGVLLWARDRARLFGPVR